MDKPGGTRWLGKSFRFANATGSTNDDALAWARDEAPHGALLVADQQSAGRGRQGRAWASPPGKNLYLSCVMRPELQPRDVAPVTLTTGLALADTMAAYNIPAGLKWPNDLYVQGRKLAGILTEMTTQGTHIQALVVGVGLNVNQTDFADGLVATSMACELERSLDRNHVLATFAACWERRLDRFFSDGFAALLGDYRECALGLGTPVQVEGQGERSSATFVDIGSDGALVAKMPDGNLHRFVSGEVHFEKESL